MDTAIITAIISAATTLIVSMGTWHITAKQARKKETEAMKALIEGYRDELRGKMEGLTREMGEIRNQMRDADQSVDKKLSIMELTIGNLTKNVEKHNEVVERTFKLEKDLEVQQNELKDMARRVEDLEDGQK